MITDLDSTNPKIEVELSNCSTISKDASRRAVVMTLLYTLCHGLGGCKTEPGFACPPAYWVESERTGRVLALLEQSGEPEAHVKQRPRICYGHRADNAITAEGVLLLEQNFDDRDLAARVGHLLLHLRDGEPLDMRAGPTPCRERVARARVSEEHARVLEDRLRKRFGRDALDPSELEQVVASYARRCERAQALELHGAAPIVP